MHLHPILDLSKLRRIFEKYVCLITMCLPQAPLRITSPPVDLTLPLGGSVQLNCSVEGLPFPTISWFHGEELLAPSPHFSISIGGESVFFHYIIIIFCLNSVLSSFQFPIFCFSCCFNFLRFLKIVVPLYSAIYSYTLKTPRKHDLTKPNQT